MIDYLSCMIFLALICSCKKDPPVEHPDFLKDEKEIFVGTWEWLYSDHHYGNCSNMSFFEVINPTNSGINHKLIFSPNGILRHLENDVLIGDYELYFKGINLNDGCGGFSSNSHYFGIALNNVTDNELFGCISDDTLRIGSGFLYDDYEEGCEFYNSYFLKQ